MTENRPEPVAPGKQPNWIPWGIAFATFFLFVRIIANGFINADDPPYVMKNPYVSSGLSLGGIWWAITSVSYWYWHPITWISHMIDVTLFGMRPWGHHLTSVVLYAATAGFTYVALLRLTRNQWASILATLVYLWHPLRVESVAWVAERKDVLSVLFWMIGLIFYERWARSGDRKSYWRSVIAMFCAIASKPTAVTFPFALLLLDYWPLARKEGIGKLIAEKLPFFGLSAFSVALTFVGHSEIGAVVTMQALPMDQRIANGLLSYTRYIGKMIVPTNLAVYYPYEVDIPMGVVAVSTVFIAVLAVVFFAQRRRRPYLIMGWLWYLGVLVPMLGLVQAGAQSRADRFTYLPMLGIVIMVVWLITGWTQSKVLLVIPAVLAWLTFNQIPLWKDSQTLFSHTLQVTPTNPFALAALGSAQGAAGNDEGALLNLEEAVRAQPDFVLARMNLGGAYMRAGKPDKAVEQYEAAMRLDPSKAEQVYLAGVARLAMQQHSEAEGLFRKALTMSPTTEQAAQAHNNLGLILAQGGKIDEALAEFRAAVAADGTFVPAHRNIVSMLLQKKQPAEALAHMEAAIQKHPQNAGLREVLEALKAAAK
ncbi:MAG: tetratricopeptide repeat protein [Acidobacteria bacterium]|nr:tetratricopeptide repeat protein [Acidobacteriota bacterium]